MPLSRTNQVDSFKLLAGWVLSVLAATVKRAAWVNYLTLIVKKGELVKYSFLKTELPGTQLASKFLT